MATETSGSYILLRKTAVLEVLLLGSYVHVMWSPCFLLHAGLQVQHRRLHELCGRLLSDAEAQDERQAVFKKAQEEPATERTWKVSCKNRIETALLSRCLQERSIPLCRACRPRGFLVRFQRCRKQPAGWSREAVGASSEDEHPTYHPYRSSNFCMARNPLSPKASIPCNPLIIPMRLVNPECIGARHDRERERERQTESNSNSSAGGSSWKLGKVSRFSHGA